nr:villin-3 isoform X1 [Ipomoea batatas]
MKLLATSPAKSTVYRLQARRQLHALRLRRLTRSPLDVWTSSKLVTGCVLRRLTRSPKNGASVKHTKEVAEISAFWSALGGKENFTNKKAVVEAFVISYNGLMRLSPEYLRMVASSHSQFS